MSVVREKLNILGIPVDKVDRADALSIFADFMSGDAAKLIVTPNSEILANAAKNKELKDLICSADLVIPDGIGLVYASKLLGSPLKERVTGIDFAYSGLEYIASTGQSAFLFGSKPGIAEAAAERLTESIPGLTIAGTRNGYFSESEEDSIVEQINASDASFLLVALGSPKQELFINKYKDRLNIKAAIGVGGSLDVWSGTLKRAPAFYTEHGLEWLYRLKQEPSRIKRMKDLPLFLIKVAVKRNSKEE